MRRAYQVDPCHGQIGGFLDCTRRGWPDDISAPARPCLLPGSLDGSTGAWEGFRGVATSAVAALPVPPRGWRERLVHGTDYAGTRLWPVWPCMQSYGPGRHLRAVRRRLILSCALHHSASLCITLRARYVLYRAVPSPGPKPQAPLESSLQTPTSKRLQRRASPPAPSIPSADITPARDIS